MSTSSNSSTVTSLKGSQNYIWSTNDLLGQGATGNVYRARHKKTGELYAVKWFNEQSQMRPMVVQMREFEVLKKLKHRNIVNLLDIETETQTNQKVLVMELCTEGSLYSILDNPENACGLPEAEFFNVLKDVSAGMKHLRDQSIIHRDIKPGNIMKYVGEDGRSTYKLIDFGAARELGDEEQFMSLYGTEEYLHPDLYERAVLRMPAKTQFGSHVDLWSLGVTLYHVATGQLPFRPFGGRKNRETMYKITAEKESGVISGVQSSDGGEIVWSRELPPQCRLSLGARLLVVPLLAGLVECYPGKMWTFETFFLETNSILAKKFLHVFHLGSAKSLHVYIDPTEKFAKFQELIAEQVDVAASKQYILFENIPLIDLVDPYDEIRTYPETSGTAPYILFQDDVATVKQLQQPNIPDIPHMQLNVDLDEDVVKTKACAGIMCYIERSIVETLLKQELFQKAAKMYIVVLMRQLLQMQAFCSQFEGHLEEIGKRVDEFKRSHQLNMTVVRLLKEHVEAPQDLEQEWEELGLLSSHHRDMFKGVRDESSRIKQQVDQFCKDTLSSKQLDEHWKRRGCKLDDRCLDKVDILARHVKQLLADFKKNKKQRRLSYNEEQIHKFEKSKLMIYMSEAVSLLLSHCFSNLQAMFTMFMTWFVDVSKIRKNVNSMETQTSTLVNKQNTFCEVLDKAQKEHNVRFQNVLSHLSQPSTGWVKYPQGQPNGLHLLEQGDTERTDRPTSTSTNAQSYAAELNTELSYLENHSHSLRSVLQENSTLLETLERSMALQPFNLPSGEFLNM